MSNRPDQERGRAAAWDRERWALGLMSGTSLDGIDAALLRSDGEAWLEAGVFATYPYEPAFRDRLRAVLGPGKARDAVATVEHELTQLHVAAVRALLAEAGLSGDGPAAARVGLVGFHGHTVWHDPAAGRTRQIGDGALLAAETGIDVVCDFRNADMAAGGQGAPLAPLYHVALAAALEKPLAVLNLGGVANVTWIGAAEGAVLAFDTGPGNALIDDWVRAAAGRPFDQDGALARAGSVDQRALAALLDHPYFALPPPKSLDRDAFDPAPVRELSPADGAATLTVFTAAAVASGLAQLPAPPRRWLVTGGGRHNPAIMAVLADRLKAPVEPVEAAGWNGDALEAQAFAYLAIRSLRGLPLSLPGTTGVRAPTRGGVLHHAVRGG